MEIGSARDSPLAAAVLASRAAMLESQLAVKTEDFQSVLLLSHLLALALGVALTLLLGRVV